jgi:hypothetical protein
MMDNDVMCVVVYANEPLERIHRATNRGVMCGTAYQYGVVSVKVRKWNVASWFDMFVWHRRILLLNEGRFTNTSMLLTTCNKGPCADEDDNKTEPKS